MKKIAAAILAVVMVSTMFTGCGSNGGTITLDENGRYVPTEELELTVWETQGTDYAPKEQAGEDIVADWLHEKTKVRVKDMYGNDGGQWDSKLTKLVAGNNMPDIIHCGAWQGPAHFAKVKELGKLAELTPEMIQKYAPDVWERTPEEYWKNMTVDGVILGIPYAASTIEKKVYPGVDDETIKFWEENTICYETDVTFLPKQTLYIRDDILKQFYPNAKSYDEIIDLLKVKNEPIGDELLDVPIYTTQEFIDFMYKLKDADIKEDGKNVYAFGYGGGDNWPALTWLGADMYGYKNHSYTGTWNATKQEMEVPLVHELVRQAAKTQNKMVNDKVIDPESLVHTAAAYKEKVLSGRYAIVPMSLIDDADKVNDLIAKSGKTFRYRPFITQVPANKDYPAFKEKLLWGQALCITNNLSENEVAQVLNWINTMYTDEFEQVRYWGPAEANLYTETEDGKRRFVDETFNKFFIDGDTSALPDVNDRKGLQGNAGLMLVSPSPLRSKWDPQTMWKKVTLKATSDSGFKFKKDSVHVQNVVEFPPCQVWEATFATIPEVVTYWGAREQWEAKFKTTFSVPESEFEVKWDEAIAELNNIVDIEKMEKAMTEKAKPIAEQINAGK